MDRIDSSLDDIIAAQKEKQRQDVKRRHNPPRAPNTGRVSKLYSKGVRTNVSGRLAVEVIPLFPPS